MSKVRIGVIGLGYVSIRSVLPVIANHENIDLRAVYDIDNDKCLTYAKQFNCEACKSLDEFFNHDLEAVYISTPTGTHFDLAIEAAKHGLHILCEKSMTSTYKEAKELVEFCKSKNVALLEGFMYQYHTQHQYVRDVISDGTIGDVVNLSATFGFPPLPKENFRFNKAMGGGALLDAGAYTVHFSRHFFKRNPLSIKSVLHNNEDDLDIHGTVIMDFGKNQSANLTFGFNNFYQNSYTVWGTKGKLTLTRAFSLPKSFSSTLTIEVHGKKSEVSLAPCDHFAQEIDYFIKNLDDKEEINKWYNDALEQAKTIDIIFKGGVSNEN